MIVGLHVDIASTELKALLEGRLKYHQMKVEAYTTQRVQMEKVEAELGAERRKQGKFSTSTPLENIETAIEKHGNQCIYYKFMSEHVVANETYRLSENDLTRLGISGHHVAY